MLMEFDPDLESPESLASRTFERVEISYLRALRNGIADPVVLLIDLSHPCGRRFADVAGQSRRAAEYVERAARRGVLPLFNVGVSRESAALYFRPVIPAMADALEAPCPEGMYRVAVIASGGAELFGAYIPDAI